jgi:alpha-L-fucosidase 2
LLPALPKEWPEGSVKGLCARGGFVVDISWKDGKLQNEKLRSSKGNPLKIKYDGKMLEYKMKKGEEVVLNGILLK